MIDLLNELVAAREREERRRAPTHLRAAAAQVDGERTLEHPTG
jgi:hypothetical protein